ncbi:hypothetical protein SAMN05216285_3190 [Natrinema salifodinae]|uniref:Uncharacterized protein n=1 Tax=Natrinema salifodinae TaxID=1202768 RepID=A0A1I0Q7E4_9EURY|nr:hypothetical protein SAMN05216285_3190 [Natrinema salifodinae]
MYCLGYFFGELEIMSINTEQSESESRKYSDYPETCTCKEQYTPHDTR